MFWHHKLVFEFHVIAVIIDEMIYKYITMAKAVFHNVMLFELL